ncbi:glycosyltransferase [Gilvimarinus chinensis]|uniref:glycosyltransferase n=1 Tax=Gilvimarinus chinensis TaxID=396005 RepID=UPI000367B3C1|nr:glycosyltransferase [Gilvimarinus chinensis]
METYLRDLTTALEHKGVQCVALVHASPQGNESEPVTPSAVSPKVVRAPVWANILFTPISPSFPWKLNRLLKEESPDILHLHMPNVSAFWALFLPRARRIPWVVHWHADVPVAALNRGVRWFYRLYRPFERRVIDRAATVISTSPPYMKSSPALGSALNRCRVVPLGIPEPKTTESISSETFETLPPPSPLRVIAIGRLTYYKGFEVLLQALTKCPGVALEIIGDGEQKRDLTTLIEQLHLQQKVKLLGNLTNAELDQKLRACDCLCLPSIERSEAFGVVLLEAMARSKACVVTEVPGTGMSWVVQHNQTGLVVAPHDSDALAGALTQLAANRDLCKTMGRAGQIRFRENFTIDVSAAEIKKVYDELT